MGWIVGAVVVVTSVFGAYSGLTGAIGGTNLGCATPPVGCWNPRVLDLNQI
jgi:hypothetical protein